MENINTIDFAAIMAETLKVADAKMAVTAKTAEEAEIELLIPKQAVTVNFNGVSVNQNAPSAFVVTRVLSVGADTRVEPGSMYYTYKIAVEVEAVNGYTKEIQKGTFTFNGLGNYLSDPNRINKTTYYDVYESVVSALNNPAFMVNPDVKAKSVADLRKEIKSLTTTISPETGAEMTVGNLSASLDMMTNAYKVLFMNRKNFIVCYMVTNKGYDSWSVNPDRVAAMVKARMVLGLSV
jgi:hypothetical protein